LGGKRIAEVLRNAGISVEIHDGHFDKGAQDVDWLPDVGRRGWIVLTKDARIGKRLEGHRLPFVMHSIASSCFRVDSPVDLSLP
jgi:hypothetical protein